VTDSFGFPVVLPKLKLFGGYPPIYRKVSIRGLEILSERQNVTPNPDQVVQNRVDLVPSFTDPEHHPSFAGKSLLFNTLKELQ
jgi:hypothetical protein